MTFGEDWQKQRDLEMAEKDAWACGEYVAERCPNCQRNRLCKCGNGKHRCEQCNWVPEDKTYCPIAL